MGTFVVSAALCSVQQTTSANLLSHFSSKAVSPFGKGVLELLAKRVLPAAIIVLLGILAYKYFTSGSNSTGKKVATAEDAPTPRKISLGKALDDYTLCIFKIDIEKIFKEPTQNKESLAKKCLEMFNKLKEKFRSEDLRFDLKEETIKDFVKEEIKDDFLKKESISGMLEIKPVELTDNCTLHFKIGKDNTVFSSKKPIINTDFFNILSVNANRKSTLLVSCKYTATITAPIPPATT